MKSLTDTFIGIIIGIPNVTKANQVSNLALLVYFSGNKIYFVKFWILFEDAVCFTNLDKLNLNIGSILSSSQ